MIGAAHAAGAHMNIFSNPDDALRQCVAHEVGHNCGMAGWHDNAGIMLPTKQHGAFPPNGGFADDYGAASKAKFNFK